MKPNKHFIAGSGIVLTAGCMIALIWVSVMQSNQSQRLETAARVSAALTQQAMTFAEQINRQILAFDQTLQTLVTAWETDQNGFDLEARRAQSVVLDGLSRDMVLTDENGIIRQSSVNEAIHHSASKLDFFRSLANPTNSADTLYIGPATIDDIMRQWHINVARALRHPDGSFAGVIDADYRIAAITGVFGQNNDSGTGAFVTLVGLDDGKLRGLVGPAAVDPGVTVGDTPMFIALGTIGDGIWTGPSATDAVQRIHAFYRLPGRNLAVVAALAEDMAMRPATVWRQQADLFASCLTILLACLALILVQGTRLAYRRGTLAAENHALLALFTAQLEVARAQLEAKSEQLALTLSSMSEGLSLLDPHLCLVEWNARFPAIAAIPADLLRVGLPMEEILRAQIQVGQFGPITDPDGEIAQQISQLRLTPCGAIQRQRSDGHIIEVRWNRLPDSGLIILYGDVTEHNLTRDALREASAAVETARIEKSRFIAIVSHEIRTPLSALLATIKLLNEGILAPAQRSLLATAHHSGDSLMALINDIPDLAQMQANKLTLRPILFELRSLLDRVAALFAAQAMECGITVRVVIADGTPQTLWADQLRLRQVQLSLLSHAIRYAHSGLVWLTAEPGRGVDEAVRLSVRDEEPVIVSDTRPRLSQPFARLDRAEADEAAGAGLGLAICHHLVTLMGGKIWCETGLPDDVLPADGSTEFRKGNVFYITLPKTALPSYAGPEHAASDASNAVQQRGEISHGNNEENGRLPPRTRILIIEDIAANQLVIATLLRRYGHHVDVVVDGPAAIRAMQAAPYDLVLMDIIMPGMSSQEATQSIRMLPKPARLTPVIALTADFNQADEAVCKAAGMDGLLGKPASAAELLGVLDKYVWSAQKAASTPGALTTNTNLVAACRPEETGIVPVLATGRIDELRNNLAPETFANLIEACLLDMDHQLPALRQALVIGIPAAIMAHAHALVGMAAGYGMAAVETRLRTIMTAARDGDMASLGPATMAALEIDFYQAAGTLRKMLQSEIA